MNLDDTTTTARSGDTSYLDRPGGRIGYDVAGAGPLVVLVPGMGDLRAAYRFLAPPLRAAGYRVACADLRGHGDSYPQSQRPDVTTAAVLRFLATVPSRASDSAHPG